MADQPVAKLDFSRDIKPIISNACYRCHGPDASERKGGTNGLRLDTADGFLADLGGGYAAVVPNKPESSELVKRISSTDEDMMMPPKGHGKRLTPHEIELIRKVAGKDFVIVTPGVRPLWAASGDQKRVMTPKEAIQKGADYIVVGRPITQDKNPLAAAGKILEEINSVISDK